MEFDNRPEDRFSHAVPTPPLAVNIEVPLLSYGHALLNEQNVIALKGWLHPFVQQNPRRYSNWANRVDADILRDSFLDYIATFERNLGFMATSARLAAPGEQGKLVCAVPLTLRIHEDDGCAIEQLGRLELCLRKLAQYPAPAGLLPDQTKAIGAFRNAVTREVIPAVIKTKEFYENRVNAAEGMICQKVNPDAPVAETISPHIKRLLEKASQSHGGGRGKS